MGSYSIVTFGCRVNQADTQSIEEQLLAAGLHCSDAASADVVVVNTCSVTSSADQSARQVVRKIARDNPHARIIVTGCYATRRPDDLIAEARVVQVVPNGSKDVFAEIAGLNTAERFGEGDGPCGAQFGPGLSGRTAFTLRVQTGCDERCSYCIIPSTRGRGRSRPLDAVLGDFTRAAAAGYREIVLTGVHLGSYGRDLADGTTLERLLASIDRLAGDVRVRVSSLEPMDCTDAIVDLIARSGRFAPHFHLPLQHASDRLLALMHRPYSLGSYDRLIGRIRRSMPDASIGTDLIVGFPGETDGDFAVLEGYLRGAPVTHAHVFPYSERPGTAAAALPHKVHGRVVRERSAAIRAVTRELTRRFYDSQVGRTRRALTIDDGAVAVTDNYLKVQIPAGHARNEWVDVTIHGADPLTGLVAHPPNGSGR